MNIKFTFKNFDPSDHLKEYSRSRFEKLGKFMGNNEECDLAVNLSVEKFRQIVEVVLNSESIHISAYEKSEDMYSSIDMVLDKLEAQLRKMREKRKARRRKGRDVNFDVIQWADTGEDKTPVIVESSSYKPKPMSVDEAAEQLAALNCEFLVFHNSETEDINVIYNRKDGNFGLINPGIEQ